MFEPVYSNKDFVKKTNDRVMNMITTEEATCANFPISCNQRFGVYGIWFQDENDFLLVNPLDLVNSIFMDDTYYMLEEYSGESKENTKGYYNVYMQKWDNCYSWRIYHPHFHRVRQMQFTYENYIGRIKTCINDLYDAWSKNLPVAYKSSDVKIEGIAMCRKQLNTPSVYPSHYKLMADSIRKEDLVFRPVEDKYMEDYEIGIGDRCYITVFTFWDNDMEKIRHQFENYVYEREATIRMSFDMSDTILKLYHKNILSKISEAGEGYAFKYHDFISVEIIPNEFVRMPIIKGWGDEKEVIRELYQGLLNMALRLPMNGDENDDDLPARLVAYNRYKSPIVESFLRGDKFEPNTYCNRQVHVKHIIRINPDYDVNLWDEEGVASTLDEDFYDQQGNPVVIPEFDEWAKEMSSIVVASETGLPYEKDWVDYHRRGLELARQLREKLSTDFDLWYSAPFEDKSGTIPKSMLII